MKTLIQEKRRLFTKAAFPGQPFAERTRRVKGSLYREWDPRRSKLGAYLLKGKELSIKNTDVILYLGSAHGYTPSYISDVITEGLLFGVDPAPRVMRDFVFLAEKRNNLVPILADANHPETYENRICEVDILYQDIAQRNQVQIFLKNLRFLKQGGYGYLVIKARSIDVTKNPRSIYDQVNKELKDHVKVLHTVTLQPFQKDHAIILIQKVR